MSRLAKKPVAIPSGVKIEQKANKLYFEGPKGKLEQRFAPEYIEFSMTENELLVGRKGNSKPFRAFQGLYWSLIKNCIIGVSEGFTRSLLIQGVGYKWELKGDHLLCNVGYSHPVKFKLPEGITVTQENPQTVTLNGIDKRLVGQTAANLRFVKPPEPYKGKGIRYKDEVVKLKEGKSAS